MENTLPNINILKTPFGVEGKVLRCDPYKLLMYLRSVAISTQINVFSEIDYSTEANAILRAQEYVQSIIISSEPNEEVVLSDDEEEKYFHKSLPNSKMYIMSFSYFIIIGQHIFKTTEISDERLKEIVEAQYMYWVRGNRYQIFELEPLKALLPPHNEVLQSLFGVTSDEVISGLEKLRYALSQGYADSFMELGEEYQAFIDAVDAGADPEIVLENSKERATKIMGKVLVATL